MEYQYVLFMVQNGNRNFMSITSYSTGTFTWTPTTASQYCVLVFARVQGTNYYVATQETLVTVLPVVTNLALTASPATTAPAMTPITLTASATVTAGCTAEYKFLALQNGGSWSTLQDYSSSLVCTWTPTGAQSYTVFVYAREVGTTIYCAKMSYISYTVTPQLYPPTITGLSATCGVVGNTVTITGTNFTGATDVEFNGTPAVFTVVNGTTITATVPSGATTGAIVVTAPGGTATSGTFTLATVTNFAGKPEDVVVTITGSGFTGATDVMIGGISITSTKTITATTISFPLPNGLVTGKQDVTVTLADATVVYVGTFYVLPKFTWDGCWNCGLDEYGYQVVGMLMHLTDNEGNGVVGHDVEFRIDEIYDEADNLVYKNYPHYDNVGVDDYGEVLPINTEFDDEGYYWAYYRIGNTAGRVYIEIDDNSIN